MIKAFKSQPSVQTFFLLCCFLTICRFLLPLFNLVDVQPAFSGDDFGYYLYLPAYFIHHDTGLHDFSWVRNAISIYHLPADIGQWAMLPTGDYILKFPIGMAVLYTPFFFLGWLYANISGYTIDGFSYPFQVSMIIGNLVFTFTGLWFLRKILLKYFSEWIAAITMILVVLGTNYFQLTTFEGAMPDNALFSIFTIIVWLVIRWHENPEWKYSVGASIITGLSILVKPSSAAILLLPVFWGIFDKASTGKKWDLIKRNGLQVIIFFICIILIYFFQMIYLKLHSGNFDYYTYSQTDKLQLVGPYLPQVLLSFKKGWLIYTPIMILPLIGFYFLAENRKEIFFSTFLFFIIYLLITSSWTIWWDGDSFGQRSLIASYAILSLPLGFLISAFGKKIAWQKFSISIVIWFLIILNLFQTWQYQDRIIHPSNMTAGYYVRIFGRLTKPPGVSYLLEGNEDNDLELLKQEHYSVKSTLISYDFGKPSVPFGSGVRNMTGSTHKFALKLDSVNRFSPGLKMSVKKINERHIKGLRVTVWFYSEIPFRQNPCHIVVTLIHNGLNYRYRACYLEEQNLQAEKWNKLFMDYLVSERADTNDQLIGYIWYKGKHQIFIGDLKFEILELSGR